MTQMTVLMTVLQLPGDFEHIELATIKTLGMEPKSSMPEARCKVTLLSWTTQVELAAAVY